ncbi:dihydrodiol dehydrogenase [Streptomyces sp. NPDC005356]|uniref:dihydrodiol dehydrogenase n=1 Tax=Streptomyces sp. NPDC005356 TaxID=3157167 RepID=UPI0033B2F30F
MTTEPPLGEGVVRAGESFGIGNEFTGVQVRKVWTRQGERLELFVPKRGYRILLDAMQLEIIAAQEPGRFSELFAISFGAEEPAPGEGDV